MGAIQSITAAATRIITRKGAKGGTGNGYQTVAWDLYEQVPEVGAYGDWVAAAMSGATLYAGTRNPDGTVDRLPDDSRAAELVSSMAGGPGGQAEMLGSFGTNLSVAGEAWLVIVPDPNADSFADDKWYVLSTEEVKPQRGKFKVTIENVERDIPEYNPDVAQDPDAPVVMRVWKQSPRRRWEATSPVIRSITVLEELRLLNAAVAAIARSRITGRGVLLVPAGTRFPGPKNQQGADDSLLDTFIEVASTAMKEPESAAATVPIVLEIPGDLINGVKWLQFASDFDALAIQLRDEAIRRFATGADVPAEVLLGLGDASHWGAWALTAEALRMGAEPRLGLVCHSLTTEWLRPLLESEGDADAADVIVWYDTSSLRSSSNKGASALEAFKLKLINAAAARRELGFTDADAYEILEGEVISDTTVTEGNELPVDETQAPPAQVALAASAFATPDTPYAAALTAAVDGMVYSALVAAGNRIMRTPICPRPDRGAARMLASAVHTRFPVVDARDIAGYKLLDGAWLRADEIAARYGIDALALAAALDDYASALLVSGEPHTFDNVTRMLAQSGILPSTLIGMTR